MKVSGQCSPFYTLGAENPDIIRDSYLLCKKVFIAFLFLIITLEYVISDGIRESEKKIPDGKRNSDKIPDRLR
jgi:hypothetical protein